MNVLYKIRFIILLLITTLLYSENNYPIFLIHGFMGWGRDELSNHYYWGGTYDLQEILREEGFIVHTLSVGPISSNWDRAIEVFYQLKGGQVDYGFYHSQKNKIIQKPKEIRYVG